MSADNVCATLRPKEWCFRVKRYNQGTFEDVFHEHVTRHRVNKDDAAEAVRCLVARFSELSGSAIIRSMLNRRRGKPMSERRLDVVVYYPEPGVVRRACGANVVAWVDEVANEAQFRRLE